MGSTCCPWASSCKDQLSTCRHYCGLLSHFYTQYTVKILIEAWAFIRIMVDAEVGSGRLLEATVLE